MPAASALATASVNAVALVTVVAMPSTLAETAVFSALIMVGMVCWLESAPVHWMLGMPSSAHASAAPFLVGTKKALSVTWLTKVNFHFGVVGKFPTAPDAALLDGLELHAARNAE